MSNFEHRITEDSTEFEKAFLKIYDGNLWTALDKMKDWQPPKPLVVVPQIVADFIEVRKKSLKLYDAFQEIEECYCGELYNFVCQKRNGQDLFARAWIDGYTVEKEKLYEVVFSKCEDGDRYLLFANIEFFIGIESMNDGYYRQQFTEAEIKAIDDRYWAFAVPVEEVEP